MLFLDLLAPKPDYVTLLDSQKGSQDPLIIYLLYLDKVHLAVCHEIFSTGVEIELFRSSAGGNSPIIVVILSSLIHQIHLMVVKIPISNFI